MFRLIKENAELKEKNVELEKQIANQTIEYFHDINEIKIKAEEEKRKYKDEFSSKIEEIKKSISENQLIEIKNIIYDDIKRSYEIQGYEKLIDRYIALDKIIKEDIDNGIRN